MRISTASAIDLAGSEDNRRTENGKERLVESASINKSLFVLAQCVEAIGEKKTRIPYRESKMTRILSLGQNNGLTLMILNLAPIRSYHLDTLSSLNFANRTKRIEVREIENEPIFKGCPRPVPAIIRAPAQRQPLRPLASTVHNTAINVAASSRKPGDRPVKAFSVYSDKSRSSARPLRPEPPHPSPRKRPSDSFLSGAARPPKRRSPNPRFKAQAVMSKETIENIIERKVTDILATRALDQPSAVTAPEISEDLQRRLEMLEQKIEGIDDGKEQGLTFLLMAKQHSVRGECSSALKMYSMAKEYFPNNTKLQSKIDRLREKLQRKTREKRTADDRGEGLESKKPITQVQRQNDTFDRGEAQQMGDDGDQQGDNEYHDSHESISDAGYESADSSQCQSKQKKKARRPRAIPFLHDYRDPEGEQTPRTERLLAIVNTRDTTQIRLLKGVGVKKAECILEALCAGEDGQTQERRVGSLSQLACLKGVGAKTVENMRMGFSS